MQTMNNAGSVAGDLESVYSAFAPTENENMSIYAYSLADGSVNGGMSLNLDDDEESIQMPAPVKKRYEACNAPPKMPSTEHGMIPMTIMASCHDSVHSMWTSYEEEEGGDEPTELKEKDLPNSSYHTETYQTETDDSSVCESPVAQPAARVVVQAPRTTTRPRPSLADCYTQSTPAIMVGGGASDRQSTNSSGGLSSDSHNHKKKSSKMSSFWSSMRFGKKNSNKDHSSKAMSSSENRVSMRKMKDHSSKAMSISERIGSTRMMKDSSSRRRRMSASERMGSSFRRSTRTKTVVVSLKKTSSRKSHVQQQPQKKSHRPEEDEYRSERRASF